MKKCYLKIYLNHNLGDDIFAKIISEKYPNTKFIATSYNKPKSNFRNIKLIKGNIFRIINKILKILTNKKITIEKIIAKRCKVALVIGGSLFIEGKSDNYDELKNAQNYYIVGTNFGPYKTKEYIEYCNGIFKNAKYVCFRDKASYDMFKNLGKNINLAPDIVYGLYTSKILNNNDKRVIFSIIDCKRKIKKEYEEEYDDTIISLTKYFIEKNYKITYMSFCKNEGDEEAIERIEDKLPKTIKDKIDKYYYNGNINEALNVLGNCQIIIGSRFHANIIGMTLGKTIIPIIYSEKTKNALKDISFNGKMIDIKRLKEFNLEDLQEKDLEYKIDISKEKEESKKHLEKLNEIL